MNEQFGQDSLIEHYSHEIQTLTSNIMTFRIRISFTVFIGPYFLLGSIIVGTKGNFTLDISSWWVLLAFAVASVMYIGLGFASGRIEKQAWIQCEEWTKLIIQLANRPEEAKAAMYKAVSYAKHGHDVAKLYPIVFLMILISLFAIGYIVANISPNSP